MRKVWDIHGGIHPPENKVQSLTMPIATATVPPQLIFPLSQHIGQASKPIVTEGEYVLKGQCIAEADGFVSANIHASSSGTVIAIEERAIPHPSGIPALCIIIETDGKDEWIPLSPQPEFETIDTKELIKIVRKAGITGLGGAGFPTDVKLSTQKPIETLIINGTECEPYITADHALMREQALELCTGIAILAKIFKPQEILIGIEDNKLDVVSPIEKAINQTEAKFEISLNAKVITFPTKYPSGGEKQLIEILTGKQVPSGKLPAELGIACQNMGTTVAIYDAVVNGKPLISRITTVTGESVDNKGNYHALLGTPMQFLLDQAGYNADTNNRLVMGGPMMGITVTDANAPIIKTTNCILAPTEKELPTPPPAQACIRCGMCAEACPASLLPQQLYWFAQGKELEKLESHNLFDCIECGACSYVCPSHIPLVQYYRASKAEIKDRDNNLKLAELAKQRFEARQERLERLEQEKIAARKARQAKAKAAAKKSSKKTDDTTSKAAVVAAAMERVKQKKQSASKQSEIENTTAKQVKQKTIENDDPVARALRKREELAATAAEDPRKKLFNDVEMAKTRVEKATVRLAKAEKNNDEHISAFKTGLEKAQLKLSTLQQALNDYDSQQKTKEQTK